MSLAPFVYRNILSDPFFPLSSSTHPSSSSSSSSNIINPSLTSSSTTSGMNSGSNWDLWNRHPSELFHQLERSYPSFWDSTGTQFQPLSLDLVELADKFIFTADTPGAKDEDIELSISNGMLGVRVSRQKTVEHDSGLQHRIERSYTELRRMVPLPSNIDTDHAEANLKNGILTITFPKVTQSVPAKKIPVVKM